MPALDLRAVHRQHSFVLDIMRRIHSKVLPSSNARLNRSETLLSGSAGRQLETTQRILDPDSNCPRFACATSLVAGRFV